MTRAPTSLRFDAGLTGLAVSLAALEQAGCALCLTGFAGLCAGKWANSTRMEAAMTDDQLDRALNDLADSIMRGETWENAYMFETESDSERRDIYGGDPSEWTHYASTQVYGSSAGPDLQRIIEQGIGAELDFDVVDELLDLCNERIETPDFAHDSFVWLDDNCLWAIWLFDGDPTEDAPNDTH